MDRRLEAGGFRLEKARGLAVSFLLAVDRDKLATDTQSYVIKKPNSLQCNTISTLELEHWYSRNLVTQGETYFLSAIQRKET